MYPPNPTNYRTNQSPHPSAPPIPSPSSQPAATGYTISTGNFIDTGPVTPGPWSTGLCDCCSDVPNCCITCWCPCITFGQIAEIVDKGNIACGTAGALYTLISTITGYGCLYSCFYHSKLRNQYLLPETPCTDCLVHCCCETCALCQEYRELKHRGFDMSIEPWSRNGAGG